MTCKDSKNFCILLSQTNLNYKNSLTNGCQLRTSLSNQNCVDADLFSEKTILSNYCSDPSTFICVVIVDPQTCKDPTNNRCLNLANKQCRNSSFQCQTIISNDLTCLVSTLCTDNVVLTVSDSRFKQNSDYKCN
jgi:hypothetical protein